MPWGEGVQRTGGNIISLYLWEREKILNERSEFSILGEGFIRGQEEPRGQANISNEDLNTPTITNLNVSILPSCPQNFGFSDCYPPLPSLIREGANLSKSDVKKSLKRVQDDINIFPKRTYSPINLFSYSHHKKAAFTLAEVLITLGIIGVVVAMTLPSLIQKFREKEYTTKLKKFYTVMENAGRLVEEEYGTVDTWGLTNSFLEEDSSTQVDIDAQLNSKTVFWQRYGQFINLLEHNNENGIKKIYGMDKKSEIPSSGGLKQTWFFNDGTMIRTTWLGASGSSCTNNNKCGDLSVDLNGDKGPNAVGHDIFFFQITRNGIKPLGYQGDTSRPFDKNCVYNQAGAYNGYGCTAWVIYNENMDYLHCDGLGWDKKLRCR